MKSNDVITLYNKDVHKITQKTEIAIAVRKIRIRVMSKEPKHPHARYLKTW